ncbi:MAG: alpha/beta fold hydrolase [Chloroflexota bacterium]|jgi:pimeloyl-ACP methyl ester carboxylesterase|nr:alpha/beta fold hydrolase [Chloroflexota bacterium]|tara:strand:+ start:106 stop:846 length:741 start_codon:yes stop_codon:yes gene_type:complete
MIYHNKFGINSNKIIVGIHGWGGTNNTFLPIQKKLNDEFTMINFDLPGYGKSKKPSSWDLENIVDSLAVEINKITSKEVDILGNCSGALISILLSKSKKIKVGNLYLIDPFSKAPWYFRIFTNKIIGDYAYSITFQNPLGRIFTNLSLRKKRREDTDMTSSFKNVDKETSINYLKMLIELEGTDVMKNISCKPVIINGENTFKDAIKSVDYFTDIWPDLDVIKIKDAGHLPIEESTEKIIEIVSKK